jgi:tetratricopeptide (TPR) repeat protein
MILLAVSLNPSALDERSSDLNAVLEMCDWELFQVLDPLKVIDESTKALANPERLQKHQIQLLHRRRAEAFGICGKLSEASRDFDCILSLSPQDKYALLGRAKMSMMTNNQDQGIKQLKELVQLHPDFSEGFVWLADSFAARTNTADAFDFVNKAIAIDRKNAHAHVTRSQLHYLVGDIQKSLLDISRAIDLNPMVGTDHIDYPYIFRGKMLTIYGNYPWATSDFEMALVIRNSWQAKYGMWRIYSETGRAHLACYTAREIVKGDESRCEGWAASAISLAEVGKDKESREALKKAMTIGTAEPDTICDMGFALQKHARYDDAMKHYDEALRVLPNHPYANRLKADLLANCPKNGLRDGKKALELATKICEQTKSTHIGCARILASAYRECGELDKSEEVLTTCLKANEYLCLYTNMKVELENDLTKVREIRSKTLTKNDRK